MNRSKRDGRLLLLYVFFRGGNTMNISRIASVFHVSTRTVYRDLERMRKALNEVVDERKKLFMEDLFPQD